MIDAAEGGGRAAARAHDPRAVERQHRHLAGDASAACAATRARSCCPSRPRPSARTAAAVRRRDRLLAGRARLERRGRAGPRAGRGRPLALHAVPVRATRRTRGAHYRTHGREILRDCPEVDVVRRRSRHGRHADGLRPALREANPDVQIVAAEPLAGRRRDGPALARGRLHARDPRPLAARPQAARLERRAVRGLRALAREEGIFAGVSSGGVLHVALRVAARARRPANIVMVFADGGWKYLSAGLWDARDRAAGAHGARLWW